MPRPHPVEFRQRAVDLARSGDKPVAEIAADLGISDSCLRNWMKQADLDEGRRSDGLSTAEREELVQVRRELKVARLENEILKRAAAYFARENVLPK
jgi:transposase-like protein